MSVRWTTLLFNSFSCPPSHYDHTIRSSFAHASWSMRKRWCDNFLLLRALKELQLFSHLFKFCSSSSLSSLSWFPGLTNFKDKNNWELKQLVDWWALLYSFMHLESELEIKLTSLSCRPHHWALRSCQHFQPIRHKSETNWNLFAQIFTALVFSG